MVQDPTPAVPRATNTAGQLGERLRQQMGWTLQDLSRRSGVSLSTLSKIENAQVAPTFDTLVKAAKGLGIGFEALPSEPAPSEPPAPPGPAGLGSPDGDARR
ncbi:MAG: helix-turn-helix transcriptional regulator [Candidatus Saccharibacteria bacterium]|nr:helix-turn-helix transcriptional regulator [Pseudorhodobacter sp.]